MAIILRIFNFPEFYGSESTTMGQAPLPSTWMPFSLTDLVPMSLALRDVALGLIELAFPESRPSVQGSDYARAIRSVQHADYVSQTSFVESELYMETAYHLFGKTVDLLRQLYVRDTR